MNPRRYFFAVLCLMSVIGGTMSTVRADIVIDDFSVPSPAISYEIAPGANPTIIHDVLSSSISRTITLSVINPATPGLNALSGSIGGGNGLTASFDVFSSGSVNLVYAFSSAQDLSGTTGGGVNFNALSNGGFQNALPYVMTLTTATGTLTVNGSIPQTVNITSETVAYSSMTGSGDLSQVTGLQLTFSPGRAADFLINDISLSTAAGVPNAIPAPPAIWLALLALPALRLRKRLTPRTV